MTLDIFSRLRSIIETPVLDAHKWAKLPSIPADGVLCDMEDAVPLGRKLEGRAAVIAALADLEQFRGRPVIARPNALDTEWGRDDAAALAATGVELVMLPKVGSASDVRTYLDIFDAHRGEVDARPELIVCIETAAGVLHVEEIVRLPEVRAVAFGEGDLTAELGVPIHEPDGTLNPLLQDARSRVLFAAAAHGVARFDNGFLPDIRDIDMFRARAEAFKRGGATGMIAIYPPHVAVINEVFTPGQIEIDEARAVVEAFDAARADGRPAIQLDDGRTLLIHDYTKAVRTLEIASSGGRR